MFANFPALLLFAIAASVTPGPNNLMLMQSGAAHGLRRTLPHIGGIEFGSGLLIAAIGGGLAGVVAHAPGVLVVLKWAGAAFLLVLAYRIARPTPAAGSAPSAGAAREPMSTDDRPPADPPSSSQPLSFFAAAAFQWVNPKVWLSALTGMVTFTVPGAYAASSVVVLLTMMGVTLPCAILWTGIGTLFQRWLGDPWRRMIFNYAMAAMLVGSLYPMLLA